MSLLYENDDDDDDDAYNKSERASGRPKSSHRLTSLREFKSFAAALVEDNVVSRAPRDLRAIHRQRGGATEERRREN